MDGLAQEDVELHLLHAMQVNLLVRECVVKNVVLSLVKAVHQAPQPVIRRLHQMVVLPLKHRVPDIINVVETPVEQLPLPGKKLNMQ